MIRLLLNGCLFAIFSAHSFAVTETPKNPDPWEGANRKIHSVNAALDAVFMKPAARVARATTPGFVREGVGNFFRNLGEVPSGANKLLQGRPRAFARGALRFLINSTMGVFGIFDVASRMGLKREHEDFGQTLALWGAPPGPYVVLPFFGPSTVRDSFGRVTDIVFSPLGFLSLDPRHQFAIRATDFINQRADLLPFESVVLGDEYEFYRSAYLQRRSYLIEDGEAEDSFLDDEF